MPIGVPRIIYCWGEELPAQWTDIYNFIFRRRMVFLMQYLDDELCNQICGLLINIHMEDRSKELEKKEMENSGLFKSSSRSPKPGGLTNTQGAYNQNVNSRSNTAKNFDDLLLAEDDLAIDQNTLLEKSTLQKISLDWLNWNSQFFDYSEEPYLFYLSEILAKDFAEGDGNLFYPGALGTNSNFSFSSDFGVNDSSLAKSMARFKNTDGPLFNQKTFAVAKATAASAPLDLYSPFRLLANVTPKEYNSYRVDADFKNGCTEKLRQMRKEKKSQLNFSYSSDSAHLFDFAGSKLKNEVYQGVGDRNFVEQLGCTETETKAARQAIAQRNVRGSYSLHSNLSSSSYGENASLKTSYLDMDNSDASYAQLRDYYRKQTERSLQEEESKKVFMIINSFGGSVGNGITVHDALQFIKAGSLTLALGVAASAASLALAGGTIGERYVTEGCHVMIHQPEGGLNGQASDIWIDSQEIMKIRLDVAEIYSLSTYRPRHKILRDLDRDFYLTATETIYYGLADEIATNEVMHEIIEMTSKVWDYHDGAQQRLLQSRDAATAGTDTQAQS
uniref:ATP-dependent Clp protease proteolytic subunit n=1 Tax=Johansenicoccus eremophilus TaxID=3068301 RepID=A0AA49LM70_9CHLO|nr:ATP-dependent Clp protease proteolytic subunit [Chlorophyceae sp. KF-2023a]